MTSSFIDYSFVEAHDRPLTIRCPHCDADFGVECHDTYGNRLSTAHSARRQSVGIDVDGAYSCPYCGRTYKRELARSRHVKWQCKRRF